MIDKEKTAQIDSCELREQYLETGGGVGLTRSSLLRLLGRVRNTQLFR